MTTINKKSLEQVLKEIQNPVQKNKKTSKGYGYYSIDMYENCLKNVVGMSHFTATYKDNQHIILPSGQVCLMTVCSLSFIDDEGKICFTTNGIGTYALSQMAETNLFINLGTAGYCLQTEAFKSACRSLQMFGVHDDTSEDDRSAKPSSGKAASAERKKEAAQEVKKIEFFTSGAVEVLREDSRTHKPVYKVYGNRVSDGTAEQTPSAILFYPNMYKNDEELLNRFITICSDGLSHNLRIQATESSYAYEDMPQYIFKSFWTGR